MIIFVLAESTGLNELIIREKWDKGKKKKFKLFYLDIFFFYINYVYKSLM